MLFGIVSRQGIAQRRRAGEMRVHLRAVEHRAHRLDHFRGGRGRRLALLEEGDVAAFRLEPARQRIDFEPVEGLEARCRCRHNLVAFAVDQGYRLAFAA